MKKAILAGAFVAIFVTTIALSQESAYVGQETRDIKALSQGDIDGYLGARGMGFAKVAELNHYPGPKHVLEFEEQLELTPEQVSAARDSFRRMRVAALDLGRQLVEKERELDELFAQGRAAGDNARELIAETARIRGELRYAHVRAHVEMRGLLSAEQVARYDVLRGYGE